jgi:hypothetical protein
MLAYVLAIAIALASLILYTTAFFFRDIHRKDDFFWSGVGLFYALFLWVCAQSITGAVLLGQLAATALLLSFAWQTLRLRWYLAHPGKAKDWQGFSLMEWLQQRLPLGKKTPIPPTTQPEIPLTPPEVSQESGELATPETVPTPELEIELETETVSELTVELPVEAETPENVATIAVNEIVETPEVAPIPPAETAREVEIETSEIFTEAETVETAETTEISPESAIEIEEETVQTPSPISEEKSSAKKRFSLGNFLGLGGIFRRQKPPTIETSQKPESIAQELDNLDAELEGDEKEGDWQVTETTAVEETSPLTEETVASISTESSLVELEIEVPETISDEEKEAETVAESEQAEQPEQPEQSLNKLL